MKVVIAIDSFKGSLTSLEAGNSAAAGVRRVFPDAECIVRPLADGGEGTVDALVAACEGKKIEISVTGPLGEPVLCQYGLIDTFAISEEIHERFYKGYHDVKLPHKFK